MFPIIFIFLFSILNQTAASQFPSSNSYTQNNSLSLNLDSIFFKLPSLEQVQQAIISGDIFAMAKLIQTITQKPSNIACDDINSYSNQVIGMVKVALIQQTFLSGQL